ncbi:hypothetical protein EYF80_042581 [Liparis tanakae]|uniref:Uncharacterized protein n=1 Tax=Liparis tanakae TaxID=230148 RepID=A0A4Z2G2W0_9TELE|nr:hypothetical protein EYF80_042581 [Liparis tanakae]
MNLPQDLATQDVLVRPVVESNNYEVCVRVRAQQTQQAVPGAVTAGGTQRAQPARGEELRTGCERHDCDQWRGGSLTRWVLDELHI